MACRRLDGIPLALELAAARAAVLGMELLVARLDDRLQLLSGADGPPSPATKRCVLRWTGATASYPIANRPYCDALPFSLAPSTSTRPRVSRPARTFRRMSS